jgi:CheY-like chemotaxis protein
VEQGGLVNKALNIFILEDEIDSYPRNQLKDVLKGHNLTIAKSFPEAKKKFHGPYDLLLLDHDMEGFYELNPSHPNTGHQFVKWMVLQEPVPKPPVILHSQNHIGRKNMSGVLHDHGFTFQEVPFGPPYIKALKEQYGL